MVLKPMDQAVRVVPDLETFGSVAGARSMEMDMDAERNAEKALRWKAPAAMVLVQLFYTGMILLSKVAIGEGMFIFALLAYRSFFGAAIMLPLALVLERGKWKEMDWRACGWIFFNAFIGYAVPMSFYYYGLRDTTASYAAIFMNIIPLVTFILSLIFRLESLQFGAAAGWLKIGGVLLSVGGTMVISLYKGVVLHLWPSIPKHHKDEHVEVASHQLRGTMSLVGSTITFACWYLIQSKILKVYPYKYSWSSMVTCLIGGVQTLLFGIMLRRDRSAWKLGWDLQLATVAYLFGRGSRSGGMFGRNTTIGRMDSPANPCGIGLLEPHLSSEKQCRVAVKLVRNPE